MNDATDPGLREGITVAEFAAWRRAARPLQVLDVREEWEHAVFAFDDTLAVPLAELPARFGSLPRGRPLVVVCHHGIRSAQATAWLRHKGVHEAVNLQGGIDAWAREIDPHMATY